MPKRDEWGHTPGSNRNRTARRLACLLDARENAFDVGVPDTRMLSSESCRNANLSTRNGALYASLFLRAMLRRLMHAWALGPIIALGAGGCVVTYAPVAAPDVRLVARDARLAPAPESAATGGDAPARPARARAGTRRQRAKPRAKSREWGVSAAYRKMRTHWHRPASEAAREAWLAEAPPPLVLVQAGTGERFVLVPDDEEGTFSGIALDLAEEAFGFRRTEKTKPVSPRLLSLLYRTARHFEAPWITLVSGYRPGRNGSRHTHGNAADIVLPGVRNTQLAAYLRRIGFVGVGIYPKSGFVHLDVRDASYFWIDRSPPGRRQRLRQILPDLAKAMDKAARARGERP